METIVLSDHGYDEQGEARYGDCFIIDNGTEMVVFDCGSVEHAERVIEYMKKNGYKKTKIVLSHNDSDHFNGVEKLVDEGKVSSLRTILLLKHTDDILKELDDDRRKRESTAKKIKELYDNIAKLSERCELEDIYDDDGKLVSTEVIKGVMTVGPDYDYVIQAVAKHIKSTESDNIDGETIYNATSVHMKVVIGTKKLLLVGDSSFAAMENEITKYDVIQLPHHGKLDQAEDIFTKMDEENKVHTVYVVSDNTGETNGGSDDLMKSKVRKGHIIWNTKEKGDILISQKTLLSSSQGTGSCLGFRV